jgi:hypothetical protein
MNRSLANQIAALEELASGQGTLAAANKAAGARAPGMIFDWIAKARKAKEVGDKSSCWYITGWRHEGWFTDLLLRARAEFSLMMDARLRSECAFGITTNVRDNSTGYKLQSRNMANWYKTDDQLLDEFLLPRSKYLWESDVPGEPGYVVPVWEFETVQIPASLRAKVMSSTVSGWRDVSTLDVNINPTNLQMMPAPWLPKAQIVDAEFKELPAPAEPTEAELRDKRKAILLRQAQEHLADPSRIVRPDPNHPAAYTGGGRPTSSEPQERTAGERDANGPAPAAAAPYVAPRPVAMASALRGPTPSYVRRSAGPTQGVRPDGSRESRRCE